ncbi:MAG: peptide chain release factor N(5)-glutamine methyltransferase, partial [Cyanobacteria bacterium P01_A01_bin.17]
MHTASGAEIWHWQQWAKDQLQPLESEFRSDLEAELDWLLQEVAGLDRLALRLETYRTRKEIVLERSLASLTQLWKQRLLRRQPLQQLLGLAPWRDFVLQVTPDVLIPRPETELLIDLAIAAMRDHKILERGHWADLGTGSGAIALGLAMALPQVQVHAVDWSRDAVAIATQNTQTLDLQDRIQFYQGSWLAPLDLLEGQLSGIISNPPYIPSTMVPELQPEVAWHEPHLALDGGEDGLDSLLHIIAEAPQYLCSGGLLLLEMMAGQDRQVSNLLHQQGQYCDIQIHSDFAGI